MSARRLFVTWSPYRSWSPDELDRLAGSGRLGVRMSGPVRLDEMPAEAALGFLRLLREAAGAGLRVLWRGRPGDVPVALIRHLSPPVDEAVGGFAWHRPGPAGLMLRYGPGFVVVEDRRTGRLARTVIAAADPRYALLREVGGDLVRGPARFEPLLDAGLALPRGDWVVGLAVRARRRAAPAPPVPSGPVARQLPLLPLLDG
ncbi:MAG TPA: DUF5825 family protein [Candidatus Limnocylindrales bacterium]|nr:DUF5825 family protein [Candidatus Limnocylindrales bacterium]